MTSVGKAPSPEYHEPRIPSWAKPKESVIRNGIAKTEISREKADSIVKDKLKHVIYKNEKNHEWYLAVREQNNVQHIKIEKDNNHNPYVKLGKQAFGGTSFEVLESSLNKEVMYHNPEGEVPIPKEEVSSPKSETPEILKEKEVSSPISKTSETPVVLKEKEDSLPTSNPSKETVAQKPTKQVAERQKTELSSKTQQLLDKLLNKTDIPEIAETQLLGTDTRPRDFVISYQDPQNPDPDKLQIFLKAEKPVKFKSGDREEEHMADTILIYKLHRTKDDFYVIDQIQDKSVFEVITETPPTTPERFGGLIGLNPDLIKRRSREISLEDIIYCLQKNKALDVPFLPEFFK